MSRSAFRTLLRPALAGAATVALAGAVAAQAPAAAGPAPYAADFAAMQTKFIELAEAFPADKFGWRPMEGVRSVSEVFMLIVAENYVVPGSWGAAAPAGVTVSNALFRELAGVTGKAEVVAHLKKSAEHFRQAVAAVGVERLGETVTIFGRARLLSEGLYLVSGDMHEHLGQAIAYARSNAVVPPWTARRSQGN